MKSPNFQSRNLVALDILRFFCAMLVVSYHVGSAYAVAPDHFSLLALRGLKLSARLVPTTWFGWAGVEIFFLISGYVIAVSASGSSPGAFLRRRALRLMPAAWICGSITAVLLLSAGIDSPNVVTSSWLASALFDPFPAQIDSAFWTVHIEVSFYGLVTICLLRNSSSLLEDMAKLLAGVSVAFWILEWTSGITTTSVPSILCRLLLLPDGCFFAAGVLLERRSRNPQFRDYPLLLVALAGCVMELIAHTIERERALHMPLNLGIPLALFAIAVLIVANCHRWRVGGRIARVATALGLMTYPVYLLNQDAGAVIVAWLLRCGFSYEAAAAIDMSAVVAVSMLVTMTAEPRLRMVLADLIAGTIRIAADFLPRDSVTGTPRN